MVEKVINFIINHWEILSSFLLCVITGIIQLLKKKPVTVMDSLKTVLLKIIPIAINAAELSSGKKGDEKLDYCIDVIYNAVKNEITLSEFNKNYRGFVVNQIESILATPQKKEVSHEAKDVK